MQTNDPTNRQDSQRGGSLVEVVVTLALVAVVFLGLATTSVGLSRSTGTAKERDLAREAARDKLAEILAWPDFASLPLFDGESFPVAQGGESLVAARTDGDRLPGHIRLEEVERGLYRVTVEVAWRGTGGDGRLDLTALVTNTELEGVAR